MGDQRDERKMTGRTFAASTAVLAAVAAVTVLPAVASTPGLTYRGCITGETESGPAGSGACAAIAGATLDGVDSGLDRLQSVATSADGKSLYTASDDDSAIGRFKRNTHTGALRYMGCITGDTASGPAGTGACAVIPTASTDGNESGLDDPDSVTVSADGKSVYAASDGDAAVARFRRNRQTGALAWRGCITGEVESGPDGSGACTAIPGGHPRRRRLGLRQPGGDRPECGRQVALHSGAE